MEKRQDLRERIIQFIKYSVSGGVYFWTGYLVFFICDKGFHWTLWWAKLTANLVGWTVNYILQRYWAFENSSLAEHRLRVTRRYIIITLVDFLLDYVIVRELKVAIGITPYIGQFVSAGFFTFWNYAWYRWWVFPEPRRKSSKAKE